MPYLFHINKVFYHFIDINDLESGALYSLLDTSANLLNVAIPLPYSAISFNLFNLCIYLFYDSEKLVLRSYPISVVKLSGKPYAGSIIETRIYYILLNSRD